MEGFAETDRLLTDHFGVSARRVEGEKLPEFDPAIKPGLAGAFHYEDDAHLRPDRLTESWAGEITTAGGRLMSRCELLGIETDGRRITRLQTTRGALTPDRVVVATGAWSTKLGRTLRCEIPIEPGKGVFDHHDATRSLPERIDLVPGAPRRSNALRGWIPSRVDDGVRRL